MLLATLLKLKKIKSEELNEENYRISDSKVLLRLVGFTFIQT